MGNLGLEIRWQIDDVDGSERALLWADTTSNAETLRNEGDLRLGRYFDTETSTSHNRAGLFAFLSAFLGQLSAHRSVLEVSGLPYLGLTLQVEDVLLAFLLAHSGVVVGWAY